MWLETVELLIALAASLVVWVAWRLARREREKTEGAVSQQWLKEYWRSPQ